MDRAFHHLTIRTLDEGKRTLEGWATTGRTDRTGDIVEPLGSEFELPLPLLLDHDHALAVGEVEQAEVTSQGIRFLARIKKISEPGKAKDLTDMAWHYARHGLRKCVSIGFQPIEWAPLPAGGMRFTRWSWFELSLCTVPANPDAVIETIKRAPASARSRGVTPVRTARRGRFVSAAARRKKRGTVIASEAQYVRRARAALCAKFGEGKVPRFRSLTALEAWDDDRQRLALAKGALWIGYEALMASAPPMPKPQPVVKLGGH